MRENRLHGSEGGEGESPFRPLSMGQTLSFRSYCIGSRPRTIPRYVCFGVDGLAVKCKQCQENSCRQGLSPLSWLSQHGARTSGNRCGLEVQFILNVAEASEEEG